MLKNANATGSLKGIPLHEHTPLTHQQFMDDNLLMGKPSVQESRSLNRNLAAFSKASRMTINLQKYEILFLNTPLATQRNVTHIMGFKAAKIPSKYLGAPLIDSALKHSSWKDLLAKLETRLSQWNLCSLNLASLLVLIKSVLQAMPLYLFFLLFWQPPNGSSRPFTRSRDISSGKETSRGITRPWLNGTMFARPKQREA